MKKVKLKLLKVGKTLEHELLCNKAEKRDWATAINMQITTPIQETTKPPSMLIKHFI